MGSNETEDTKNCCLIKCRHSSPAFNESHRNKINVRLQDSVYWIQE